MSGSSTPPRRPDKGKGKVRESKPFNPSAPRPSRVLPGPAGVLQRARWERQTGRTWDSGSQIPISSQPISTQQHIDRAFKKEEEKDTGPFYQGRKKYDWIEHAWMTTGMREKWHEDQVQKERQDGIPRTGWSHLRDGMPQGRNTYYFKEWEKWGHVDRGPEWRAAREAWKKEQLAGNEYFRRCEANYAVEQHNKRVGPGLERLRGPCENYDAWEYDQRRRKMARDKVWNDIFYPDGVPPSDGASVGGDEYDVPSPFEYNEGGDMAPDSEEEGGVAPDSEDD